MTHDKMPSVAPWLYSQAKMYPGLKEYLSKHEILSIILETFLYKIKIKDKSFFFRTLFKKLVFMRTKYYLKQKKTIT